MSLVIDSETNGSATRSYVTEGTPVDLGINFLGGGGLSAPSDFNKWSLQLIQTNVFAHGLEFNIEYDTAGANVLGCEFLLPSDWHVYVNEPNIPDEGDTIISLPSAGLVMTSNTAFVPAIAYIQKVGTNYWIRVVASTAVPAKRFSGGIRLMGQTTYVQE